MRGPHILLLMSHDEEFFEGREAIHMEVRDVDSLIEMLTLAKQKAHRLGQEEAARKLGHA